MIHPGDSWGQERREELNCDATCELHTHDHWEKSEFINPTLKYEKIRKFNLSLTTSESIICPPIKHSVK